MSEEDAKVAGELLAVCRTLRASLAAATAREGRLREALENIAEGSIECVGRYQEDAMQKYARAALKETTP